MICAYRRILWWKSKESEPTKAHLFPAARFEHGNLTALCGRPIPPLCRALDGRERRFRDSPPGETGLCTQCAVAARSRGEKV